MSETNTQLAVAQPAKASDQLAAFLGIDKAMMLSTLKAQCFKGKRPDEVSDEQLAAFVSTANVLAVNPLVPGMLYAYPERNGGITPILGPDGVFKKLDEMIAAEKLKGYECVVYPEDVTLKPTHAVATIYRGGDAKPATYTALFAEWVVQSNPNWGSKPRHMIWTRAIKQAARQVIHGLPMDSDEYEIAKMQNVTGTAEGDAQAEPKPERPAPKPRATKGAAAAKVVEAEVVAEPAKAEAPKAVELVEEKKPVETTKPAAKAPEVVIEKEPEPDNGTGATVIATEAPKVRTSLNAGEVYETEIAVKELVAGIWNLGPKDAKVATPGVNVTSQGGFLGAFLCFASGCAKAHADMRGADALPPWSVGARIKVRLIGKATASGVSVRCEKFEAVGSNDVE